ncbi:hypothetical protein EVG20_g1987 [Dentipellis fragilis]|uniref:F-box domain-containing protein n=1 Tax=Dentipellis fragilis TaxID=205917 RepID=A0A4Y9ZA14_9AGAM|nr:hypothetical protein EVG20_g1987 [Dentipellis fragilis]
MPEKTSKEIVLQVTRMSMGSAVRRPSYISRMPEEILTHIFASAIDEAVDETELPPTLITITQVCRYWRQTALNYPCLWTYIPSGISMAWRAAFLERSRELPIVVKINAALEDDADPLTHMPVHRLRDLTIKGVDSGVLVEDLAHDRPAPLLEYLDLSVVGSMIDREPQVWPRMPLFSNHVPRLQFFALTSTYLSLDWAWLASLQTLTHLIITNHLCTAPTMVQLLDALACLPNLHALALRSALPLAENPSDTDAQGRHVTFPHLELLDLHGSPQQYSAFLPHISLNSSTTLRMDYNMQYHPDPDDLIHGLHSFLGSSTGGHQYWGRYEQTTALQVVRKGWDRIMLGFGQDNLALFDLAGSGRGSAGFQLVLSLDVTLNLLFAFCNAFCNLAIPHLLAGKRFITSVDTIDLNFEQHYGTDLVYDNFTFWWMSDPWMGLERLAISGLLIEKFIQEFSHHTVRRTEQVFGLCLPRLRELKITYFFFNDPRFALLCSGLKRRLEEGPSYAVDIEISRCGISESQIEELSDACGGTVCWDGLEECCEL